MRSSAFIKPLVPLFALLAAACGGGDPAAKSDPCPAGTYDAGGECTPWTRCLAGEYVVEAGTAELDRTCAPCPEGTISLEANAASCTALGSVCAPGTYVDGEACAPCAEGTFSTEDDSASCTPHTVCEAGTVEDEPPTSSSDRTCAFNAWTRQFGTSAVDQALAAAATPDGGVVVTGTTTGDLGDGPSGQHDVLVRAYDADGAVVFSTQFGTSGVDKGQAIDVGADGSVVVAGVVVGDLEGTGSGGADGFVRKYQADGAVVWTRQFGTAENDEAHAVRVAADGSVFVGGHTSGSLDGEPNRGGTDAFVLKYDADGVLQWAEQFGTDQNDALLGLGVDGSGNVYVTGYTDGDLELEPPSGGRDALVGKLDSLGEFVWGHQFGTAGDDSARALALTADGVVVAGSVTGALEGTHQGGKDIFVQKLGADGTVAWTRQFGTAADEGEPLALAVAGDGAVVVASTTAGDLGTGSAGGVDALVRTYEPDGTLRGSTQFGTPNTDAGTGVAIASDGALFVCGATEGDLEGTTAGSWDAFVMRTEL